MIVKLPAGAGHIYVNRDHVIYMDTSGDGTRIWVGSFSSVPVNFTPSLITSLSLDDAMAALNADPLPVTVSATVSESSTATISPP